MNDIAIPAADRSVTASHNREMIAKLSKMELLDDHGQFVIRKTEVLARAKTISEDVTAWTPEDDEACTALGRDMAVLLSEIEAKRLEINQPYLDTTNAINGFFNKDLRDAIGPARDALRKLAGKRVDHRADLEQKRLAEEAETRRKESEAKLAEAAAAETAGSHVRAEIKTEQALHHEQAADQIEARVANASHQDLGRTSTASGTMTGTRKLAFEIDRATVDLEALRAFLPMDALERAVTAFNGLNGNRMAVNKRDMEIKTPIKGVTFRAETTGSFR